jgi:hypothetical protein
MTGRKSRMSDLSGFQRNFAGRRPCLTYMDVVDPGIIKGPKNSNRVEMNDEHNVMVEPLICHFALIR